MRSASRLGLMISVMAAAVSAVRPLAMMMALSSEVKVHQPRQAPRNYGKRTSRYMPHQGKQECARRVRQMAKAGVQ